MLRRIFREQRGQGIVEFAVIFPIFALMLFIVIDGGLLLGRYNNINNSAKEAARLGSVGGSQAQIIDRARDQAHGELDSATTDCAQFDSFDGHAICVEWVSGPQPNQPPGAIGSAVRVKIRFRYGFLTPLPNIGSTLEHVDVTVCALQRLEQRQTTPVPVPGDSSC